MRKDHHALKQVTSLTIKETINHTKMIKDITENGTTSQKQLKTTKNKISRSNQFNKRGGKQ